MANISRSCDSTREQLIPLLKNASVLISSQLNLSDCISNGEPLLNEARCQTCHQLAACSWSYHRTPDAALNRLPLCELQRDFSLALMLIDRYYTAFDFTPSQHDLATRWLEKANKFAQRRQ